MLAVIYKMSGTFLGALKVLGEKQQQMKWNKCLLKIPVFFLSFLFSFSILKKSIMVTGGTIQTLWNPKVSLNSWPGLYISAWQFDSFLSPTFFSSIKSRENNCTYYSVLLGGFNLVMSLGLSVVLSILSSQIMKDIFILCNINNHVLKTTVFITKKPMFISWG